jgi:hypothetical protein
MMPGKLPAPRTNLEVRSVSPDHIYAGTVTTRSDNQGLI